MELIPFQPLDGPDTWYGQIHKPMKAQPFKEAGINGFQLMLPYKVSARFLKTDQTSDFHWPRLLELNVDLLPFPWLSEEERHHYLSGNIIKTLQAMYTGPPLPSPVYSTPRLPPLNILPWSIIQSSEKLFFISNNIGLNDACKLRLIQVAFQESMSWYPSCLQDGHFLVEFYICHPFNSHYNAVNQCFWLQYHTISKLQSLLSSRDTHLICPSDSSDDYAVHHKFLPFWKWLNLTHQDMFIHSPFDSASINGCKTQDCISQSDWDILKAHCNMFHIPLPHFDIPSYSIHVDRRVHVSFHDAAIANQLLILGTLSVDTPGPLPLSWQKVTTSWADHSKFLYNPDVPLRGITCWGGHSLCLLCLESVKCASGTWSEIFANFLHVLVLASLWLGVPCQLFLGRLREWAAGREKCQSKKMPMISLYYIIAS